MKIIPGNTGSTKLIALIALFLMALPLSADDAKWRYHTKEQVVSVGDVHGDYIALTSIMQQAGLLDADNNWTGGKTHFVSTGDYLDRGPYSRKVMDLFIKLEKQAEQVGGKVHILLGNHEVMNLIGDRRYVARAEYAAFIPEESTTEREKQYQKFLQYKALTDGSKARSSFNKVYPPGYFGLHEGFSPDGYYGRWLKEKPFMIIINGQIFTHGGLSETVGELGLSGINQDLNDEMNRYASLWYSLVDEGVFLHHTYKSQRENIAQDYIDETFISQHLQKDATIVKARQFIEASKTILFQDQSPVWYRGTALCHQFSEQPLVNKVLAQLNATSAYLGHNITKSHEVESRFEGRVFLQDTGMLKERYNGQASLVIHTEEGTHVFDEHHGEHAVQEQPPRVWKPPYGMTVEQLEDFLRTADVIASEQIGLGISKPQKLTLQKDKQIIHAIYKNIDTYPYLEKQNNWPRKGNDADRYHHDVAAYEVDKLLNLNIVPPTILREYQGVEGVFQFWIDNSSNRSDMIANNIAYGGFCSLASQMDLMRIFDALIYNNDRNTGNIIYKQDDWQLWLIDHTRAFAAKKNLPKGLKWTRLALTNNFRKSLKALTKEQLENSLSEYLHKIQIEALIKRRDKILKKIKRTH